jgi:hypothetical protein
MAESFVRPLVVSKDFFAEDMQALSKAEKEELTQFLERLSRNPYSDSIRSEVQTHGKYFASPVSDMVVYWSLNRTNGASGDPEKILLLKVARLHELQMTGPCS